MRTHTSNTQLVPHGLPTTVSAADQLVEMALSTLHCENTRRIYRTRLRDYLLSQQPFTREGVAAYIQQMRDRGLGDAVRMSAMAAIRHLAKEAEIRNLISYTEYQQIKDVKGAKWARKRAGMWLTVDQVQELLALPDRNTYYGVRDAAILSVLVGCGLRRDEMLHLNWDQYQPREGRMCFVDIKGKGGKYRTVPVPLWCQSDIDRWNVVSQTQEPPPKPGPLAAAHAARRIICPALPGRFCGRLASSNLATVIDNYGQRIDVRLRPHDLRRSLAKLMHRSGAGIEQIQYTLGHENMQTTTIYLGNLLEIAPGQAAVDKIAIQPQLKYPPGRSLRGRA